MSRAFTIGRMTATQTLGVKRFLGLGLLTGSPAGIFVLASSGSSADGLVEIFVGLTIGVFFSVSLPVVSLIMASSALGDERRDGTLSFIVLRPISRNAIATAKLGGAMATSFGLTGAGALALGVLMGVRSGEWGYVAPILVGAFIATACYVSVFLPLGYLTERATLIGLAFVFIWESAIAGTLPALATSSPWRIGFSAFLDLAPEEVRRDVPDFALGDLVPGVGGSTLKMLVIAALATLLTGWILRTRDLA